MSTSITIFKFGFEMGEGHERGYALVGWGMKALLDVRYGTYYVKTTLGNVQCRNLTEGEALNYLSDGQAFELLSEEPQKFPKNGWSDFSRVHGLKCF
tara:strand:- start:2102 stop:2392 length:291 start_codon:yes stop_codon:yes gene_type:complete